MSQATQNSIQINKGPSGRAIAHPIDPSLLQALYEHITIERSASAQYFAMSIWFSERELRGFSRFFDKESKAEQEHASKFVNYLIARGQTVILDDILKPKQTYYSVLDLVKETFQLEADVTSSLQQLYAAAERSNDTRTTVFLDPIIDNQISAEDDASYLIGKVQLAEDDPSALLIIDSDLYNDRLYKE